MNKEHLTFKLYEWEKNIRACDEVMQRIMNLYGGDYESPAIMPYSRMITAYTKAISEIVGDKGMWLEYYHYDCDLGKSPLEVSFMEGEELVNIQLDSVEKLARVLLA
jgi:hypothetical protein